MGQPVGRRVLRAHRGPLLRALASLTASLLAAPRPPSQRRNVGALVRRLSLLSALLHLEEGGATPPTSTSMTDTYEDLFVVG
jgi:hypothetical protein